MEHIYCLIPESPEQYAYFLREVGPRLDDAGLSFHIFRPGENIAGTILKKEVKP